MPRSHQRIVQIERADVRALLNRSIFAEAQIERVEAFAAPVAPREANGTRLTRSRRDEGERHADPHVFSAPELADHPPSPASVIPRQF